MTTVDVGDAFELVFTTVPGATVRRSWYGPDEVPEYELDPIEEDPVNSGRFPATFQASTQGYWKVLVTVTGTATAVQEHWVYARGIPAIRPLAVLGHVAEQFGAMTPAQEGLTNTLLRAASALVRSHYREIDAQIAAGLLDPDTVALGVTNMVLRVLRNPKGLRAQTIGPFSFTYDVTQAAGELVISANESAMFSPVTAAAASASAIGMVRIAAGMAPQNCRRGYRGGW